MYQILIVDDEITEREVIRFLLKKYNFSLGVQEASNGKQAWEILEKSKFDILFTDIRMPFFDGLELANNAKTLYPDIQIIFFSGYDDFTYVKKALSLHVVNYILKPVNPEEFKTTVSQTLHHLEEQKSSSEKEKETEKYTRDHILYQLINKVKVQQLKALYPHVDLTFLYQYHRLLLLQFERDFFDMEDSHDSYDLKQLLSVNCSLINLTPTQNLILISGPNHRAEWYQKLADQLAKHIRKTYHITCFVEISDAFICPDEISNIYEKTELRLTERFFFTQNTTDKGNSLELLPNHEINDHIIWNQLHTDIQMKDAEGLTRHMAMFLNTYKNKDSYSHIYVRFLCTNLLKLLWDGLSGHAEGSFDEYAWAIYNFNHFSEIETILLYLTKQLATILDQEQDSPGHAILLVKKYIHQHYNQDLSLDVLSTEVHLTPRYLSALFIKEVGCGINKYIKKVRMEKAKDLLLQTNMKISEIAQQVGYTNLSYFCKSFVDDFEMTPEKFRAKPTALKRLNTD